MGDWILTKPLSFNLDFVSSDEIKGYGWNMIKEARHNPNTVEFWVHILNFTVNQMVLHYSARHQVSAKQGTDSYKK